MKFKVGDIVRRSKLTPGITKYVIEAKVISVDPLILEPTIFSGNTSEKEKLYNPFIANEDFFELKETSNSILNRIKHLIDLYRQNDEIFIPKPDRSNITFSLGYGSKIMETHELLKEIHERIKNTPRKLTKDEYDFLTLVYTKLKEVV